MTSHIEYLPITQWLIRELDDLNKDVDRQATELVDFVEGRKKSSYPIGSKFVLNIGHKLDQIKLELDLRLSGVLH